MDKVYEKISATEGKIIEQVATENTVTIDKLVRINEMLKKQVDDLNAKISENEKDIAELKKLGITEKPK